MESKSITTRKKVKFKGTETFIKQDTGELVEMQVTDVEERDAHFHKLWLAHVINSLDLIGNKKLKVLTFILENMNKQNQFLYTYRMIEKETGITAATIAKTMTALQESNLLKKVKSGHYEINPDIIFKGGKTERLNILIRYRNID